MNTPKENFTDSSEASYQFRHFFDISPDLLCIAGFDGYFKRINPAVSHIFGYSNEELLSRPINDFVYHDDKSITTQFRNELRNSKPLMNFENRYLTKSGEVVWLSWTSMPVPSEQLVYAIAKNITHKKKLEEDRNRYLESISHSLQELKQLSFSTSHDLRSPVNNLIAVFNLLDVTKIPDDETREYLDVLKQCIWNLKQVLDDSVDQLIRHDTTDVFVEELELEYSLKTVLHSIESLIQASKVCISSNFSDAPFVTFNKAYLESIFLNLITNSIKYARPGFDPEISMISRINGGAVQLTITDNGRGFDLEKVKNKVFGLHQKFHDHPDSKGVGLYLVYNHVTSLGGQITLESELNKGSTFTITFKERNDF